MTEWDKLYTENCANDLESTMLINQRLFKKTKKITKCSLLEFQNSNQPLHSSKKTDCHEESKKKAVRLCICTDRMNVKESEKLEKYGDFVCKLRKIWKYFS